MIKVKSDKKCQYDICSLGEVMLRLDPGEGRIRTTRSFRPWAGGGEYNVARGLRKCFGLRGMVVSAFADNEVGRLIEDFIMQGGIETKYIKWLEYDGIGENIRNGLNFTERGFGIRGAVGVSDRGNSAVSQLKPGDINWDKIFGEDGVRWFHTGGIFSALSESSAEVVKEAMIAAKKYGTIVSYDLNYRPSLWKRLGGKKKAQEVNAKLAPFVDVMIGNEEDFTASLGFEIVDCNNFSNLKIDSFKIMIKKVVKKYPNLKAVAATLRTVKTATVNHWGAICWYGDKFHSARQYENLEIMDRIGGGDSFASGLIYGFLTGKTANEAVNYGAAHGALAMTTPGDTSMATLKEVEKILAGCSARVDR